MNLKEITNLDRYLLLNHPLLWASRFHKLIQYMLIMGALNFSIALFLPVGFDHIYSTNSLSIFFCVIGTIFFIIWVVANDLLSYRKIVGKTGLFYFFKVFTFIYLALVLIALLQIIPFQLIEGRIKDSILDKSLPPLDVKAYRDQLRYNKIVLDSSSKYYDEKLGKMTEEKASFSSRDEDNNHSFLKIFKHKLSSEELAENILLSSGLGVDSYFIDKKHKFIKAHYSTDNKRSKIKGYFKIYYHNYIENKVSSEFYHEQIFFRKIARVDSLNKIISPLKVYHYKNLIKSTYHYASVDAIQVSLLADRLTGYSNSSLAPIQNLQALDDKLERLESISAMDYTWPIAAIACCLIFILLSLITAYFHGLSLFLSGMAAGLPLLIIYVFYPNFGNPNYYQPMFLGFSILGMIVFAYYIGNGSTRNIKRVTILLTLGYYTVFMSILLLLNLDPSIVNGSFTLSSIHNDRYLADLFMIIFISYLVPCFYANRMEKVSFLPIG